MPPDERFIEFGRRLAAAGLRHSEAARLSLELREHYEDLCEDLRAAGFEPREAERLAALELGRLDDIAHAALSRKDLLTVTARFPVLAATGPLIAVATDNAQVVARWVLILSASGMITAMTLLLMQLAITLT